MEESYQILEKQSGKVNTVKTFPFVIAVAQRYYSGDEIHKTGDVRQRFCEIAVIAESKESVTTNYDAIVSSISVKDTYGDNMLVKMIDPLLLI